MSTSHALPRIPPVIRKMPAKSQLTSAEAKEHRLSRKRKERIILWSVLGGIAFLSLVIFGIAGKTMQVVGLATPQVSIGKMFTTYGEDGNKYEVVIKDVVMLIKHDKRNGDSDGYDKLLVCLTFKNLGPRKGSFRLSDPSVKTDEGHIYDLGRPRPEDISKLGAEIISTNDEIGKNGASAFYIRIPKGTKPVELTFSTGGSRREKGTEYLVKLPKSLTTWWEYHPNPNVPYGEFINLNVYNVEIIKDEKYLKTRIAEDTDYDKAAKRAKINREKENARIQEIVRRSMGK